MFLKFSLVSFHISSKVASLFFINTLYNIEDDIVEGVMDLSETLQHESGLSPLEYETQLGKLGKALRWYDKIDASVNTFFAVFDALIKTSGKSAVQNSSLTLKSQIGGQKEPMTKMLMA